MAFEPIFQSLHTDTTVITYKLVNGAIIVVFAFLVPLLTMEINYFRLAVFRLWFVGERERRRDARRKCRGDGVLDSDEQEEGVHGAHVACHHEEDPVSPLCSPQNQDGQGTTENQRNFVQLTQQNHSSPTHQKQEGDSSSSSIGDDITESILLDNIVSHSLAHKNHCDASLSILSHNEPMYQNEESSTSSEMEQRRLHLSNAYSAIRKTSLTTILFWIVLYSATAAGISLSTRGLEEKVVAIISGASKFMASCVVFIVSAKIPQWLGVYHHGSILLVKHSSPYSLHLNNLDLSDPTDLSLLKTHVRMGVGFHFAKFYVILMPFYCGSNGMSIVIGMLAGVVSGFVLMWFVFTVHKKYGHHRNIVAFSTIFVLIAISSLTFVRGMAWIQVVWRQDILEDPDALLAISFFSWLVLLILVHALFLRHTLKVEKKKRAAELADNYDLFLGEEQNAAPENEDPDPSNRSSQRERAKKRPSLVAGLPRVASKNSFLFDPRTHFKDGNCRFCEMSEFGDGEDSVSILTSEHQQHQSENDPVLVEIVVEDLMQGAETDEAEPKKRISNTDNDSAKPDEFGQEKYDFDLTEHATLSSLPPKRKHSAWCEVFICYSPEYQKSSLVWKGIAWFKVFIITMVHLLFIYFVIVCIGATTQVDRTKEKLPYVQEAIYNHMNEGPVCAFDNRGPESNITTFADKDVAHEAGFLVLHCGACGACSSWENLIIEYETRNTISELANDCAKVSLFNGDDAITECLMKPEIGFEAGCAQCWMEDIVCTREHCGFIFLQSQMINNVGNFAVGPNDITSATCEEANCEAGNPGEFVTCSGATRRRMNITSSIERPGEQQCAIVDIKDWNDLFFGSGVA